MTPQRESQPPIAHLHAPRYPHETVEIIGNRKGLERLINTLIAAVDQGHAEGVVWSADGHDAYVRATCLQGRRRNEEWNRSGSPLWDVDDPLVAQIVGLTEENDRLRQVIALMRQERKAVATVGDRDDCGRTHARRASDRA